MNAVETKLAIDESKRDQNTTMWPFRPLEKKVMITILVKQKETENMARVELEDVQIEASCSSQRENQLY